MKNVAYGEQMMWPDHCVRGTIDSEFHPDLDITRANMIIRKGTNVDIDSYSGFFENLANNNKGGKIAVPVKEGVVFICPSDIIRFEADGAYTHIFTCDEKYTATKNIKEYEYLLQEFGLLQEHGSVLYGRIFVCPEFQALFHDILTIPF